MCFELYIGAQVPIPEIENDYGLSTEEVGPGHPINAILNLPYTKYLSSSLGCSCGFREAFWDDESKVVNLEENPWILETYACLFDGEKGIFIEDEGTAYVGDEDNPNQHELADLLHLLLQDSERVALFGCWEGTIAEPVAKRVAITPESVRAYDFAFYHHYLYTVTKAGPSQKSG